jgi:splicing factor 3B subunit 2
MGAMNVDYKTHEALFKHQIKPTALTRFGGLYYEGKEMETSADCKPRSVTSPPPWLLNKQR